MLTFDSIKNIAGPKNLLNTGLNHEISDSWTFNVISSIESDVVSSMETPMCSEMIFKHQSLSILA